MQFNTYQFLLVFLPSVLVGTLLLERGGGRRHALLFLTLASLLFYWLLAGRGVFLLVASIVGNYAVARLIAGARKSGSAAGSWLLYAAIAANLALLGYFKYSNFFLDALGAALAVSLPHLEIALPVGISFFTFSQIAYLVDVYTGDADDYGVFDYLLFVSFFPYVTAGPIAYHREIISQFRAPARESFTERLLPGLALFAFGLFKKVVLADGIALHADALFNGAAHGTSFSALDAWSGAVAYTLQLYFDFSGYSDMALGIGYAFGIRLPLNFNSPYKALDIADFWRRWHMTLTRFFTNYVYLPLAVRAGRGPAVSATQRFLRAVAGPVLVTFLLAGLWHGAGWNFVVFGLVHGIALCIFYAWRKALMPALPRPLAWAATMFVVVVGMVLFRANDLTTAISVLGDMAGFGTASDAAPSYAVLPWIVVLGAIVLAAPNTQEIMHRFSVSTDDAADHVRIGRFTLEWREDTAGVVAAAMILCVAMLSITRASQFLYYQF
jgi:D-alanyl-lipoteichoic acid acyltransferase DltB (MBOAT superfamily)